MIQHSTGASDSVLTAIIAAIASIVVALVPSFCTKKADLETIPPKPSAECNEDFAFSVPELIQELEAQKVKTMAQRKGLDVLWTENNDYIGYRSLELLVLSENPEKARESEKNAGWDLDTHIRELKASIAEREAQQKCVELRQRNLQAYLAKLDYLLDQKTQSNKPSGASPSPVSRTDLTGSPNEIPPPPFLDDIPPPLSPARIAN